jgi:hypothetical protein
MELGWTWKTNKTKKIVRIYFVDEWIEFLKKRVTTEQQFQKKFAMLLTIGSADLTSN